MFLYTINEVKISINRFDSIALSFHSLNLLLFLAFNMNTITGKRTCSWRICSPQWFGPCTSWQNSSNTWWWCCTCTQTIWRWLGYFSISYTNQVWFIRSSIQIPIWHLKHNITFNFLFLYIYFLDGRFDDEYFQQTEESSQFRSEYETRKTKQACNFEFLINFVSCFFTFNLYMYRIKGWKWYQKV